MDYKKIPFVDTREVDLTEKAKGRTIRSIMSKRGTLNNLTEEDNFQELQSDINTLARPSYLIDNMI